MFNPNGTILAGVSREKLADWLLDAQEAYAQLAMGRRSVTVSYEGKSVTYAAASINALENWIGLLQRQLGMNCGRRAIRPYFR